MGTKEAGFERRCLQVAFPPKSEPKLFMWLRNRINWEMHLKSRKMRVHRAVQFRTAGLSQLLLLWPRPTRKGMRVTHQTAAERQNHTGEPEHTKAPISVPPCVNVARICKSRGHECLLGTPPLSPPAGLAPGTPGSRPPHPLVTPRGPKARDGVFGPL